MVRQITVATLNLKKSELRWQERAPLMLEQLAQLRPHVIGFQEVDLQIDQGNWLCKQLNEKLQPSNVLSEADYRIHHVSNPRERVTLEALAIMTRLPVLRHEGMDYLIRNRVAQRVTVDCDGWRLDFYNTHFHHELDAQGHEWRELQAERLANWIEREGFDTPKVLVGDFNALPGTTPIKRLTQRLLSAHMRLHGREPHHTLTPMSTILRGQEPPEGIVVDYIFTTPDLAVTEAGVFCSDVSPDDPSLYPSDHLGLFACVEGS